MALLPRLVAFIAICSLAVAQGAGRELAAGLGTSSPGWNSSVQQRQTTAASLTPSAQAALADALISSSRRELQGAAPTLAASPHGHKNLLPISVRDVFLFILCFLTLALSAAAGIGGGALLVPLLSLVGGFDFLETVALSNVAGFAGALANLAFNMPRKNPVTPGPIIDYDLVLLFGAPIIMGSIGGAKAAYLIPSWITKTLMLLMLTPLTWRMVKKARLLWVAESRCKQQAVAGIQAAAAAAAAAADAEAKGLADIVVSCVPDDASLQLTAANVFGRMLTLPRPHQLSMTSSAPLPAAAAAAAHEGSTQPADRPARLRRAGFDRSSSCPMQPLPERTPAAGRDVLDLFGPDLMLLKSPAAAEAAVFAQHSARELQRQRSASLRGSSFSAGPTREGTFSRSLTLSATRSLGLSFRSSSGPSRSRSLTAARSTGSKGRSTAAAADNRAAPQPAGDQLSLSSSGAPGSAQQHHHSSTAANSSPDTQQPNDTGSSSQAPSWSEELARPSAVSEADSLCTAAGVLSPFQLHQVELAHKQQEAALKRQQSSLQRRQASLQDKGSFSMRLGSMQLGSMRQSSSLRLSHHGSAVHCSGGSPTAGGLRYSGSGCALDVDVDPSSCIPEDLGGEAAAAAAGKEGSLQEAGLPVAAKSHCRRLTHDSCCHTAELEAKMTRKIEDQASHQFPRGHLTALLSMLLVVVAAAVCSQFLVQCGTWQYWALVLVPLPIMGCIWSLTRWLVLWRVGWSQCLGLKSESHSIPWTPRSTLLYPALCIIVGAVAALLGLGGASIMAPMLLELGVYPQTAAASSQAATVLSTSTAAIVYAVSGEVPLDYGISMAVIGLVATLLGQTVIGHVVRRTGRVSLLVFILAFLFVLSLGAGATVVALAVARVVAAPWTLLSTRAGQLCRQ